MVPCCSVLNRNGCNLKLFDILNTVVNGAGPRG